MTESQAVLIIFAVILLGAIVGVILLNYVGRKPLLIIGSVVQTIALLILAVTMW